MTEKNKERIWSWRNWGAFKDAEGKYWATSKTKQLGPFDTELELGKAIGKQFSYGQTLPWWLEGRRLDD